MTWREFFERVAAPKVTITSTSSRPMTKAEQRHFDVAFRKMDEAVDELRKFMR